MGSGVSTAKKTLTFTIYAEKNRSLEYMVYAYNIASSAISTISPNMAESINTDTIRFVFYPQLIPYNNVKISSIMLEETSFMTQLTAPRITTYANYIVELVSINQYDILLKLKSTTGRTDVTWVNLINSIGSNVRAKIDVIVSDSSLAISKQSPSFRYVGMDSILDINNNGVYVDQEENVRYFDNISPNTSVKYTTYNDLSNSNGQYLVTIIVDENGIIEYNKELMPFIRDVTWVDNDILIGMDVGIHTGSLFSNINYNNAKVLNIPLNIEKKIDGLLCHNINYGMSYTILLTLTS